MSDSQTLLSERWEYHRQIVTPKTEAEGIVNALNRLGSQGWELVTITPESGEDYQAWFFKRRIFLASENPVSEPKD